MNPSPEKVAQARAAAGLTQRQAATLVHGTEAAWRSWESGLRRMHPGLWELFQIKTGTSPPLPCCAPVSAVLSDRSASHLGSQ